MLLLQYHSVAIILPVTFYYYSMTCYSPISRLLSLSLLPFLPLSFHRSYVPLHRSNFYFLSLYFSSFLIPLPLSSAVWLTSFFSVHSHKIICIFFRLTPPSTASFSPYSPSHTSPQYHITLPRSGCSWGLGSSHTSIPPVQRPAVGRYCG